MARMRYSMDGKKTIPTESETFSVGESKVIGEVGKDGDGNFFIKVGNDYLSNFTVNGYRNEVYGEDSCIFRGKGKEEIGNIANCLRWIAEKLQK